MWDRENEMIEIKQWGGAVNDVHYTKKITAVMFLYFGVDVMITSEYQKGIRKTAAEQEVIQQHPH